MRSTPATALAAVFLLSATYLGPASAFARAGREPATVEPRTVQPASPFDPQEALDALGTGASSIHGTACSYYNDRQYRASFRPVYLLPITSHLGEWLQLRKARRKAPLAPLSDEVFSTRIETMTDGDGRFLVPGLKPGRYLILVPFSFGQTKTGTGYLGSTMAGNGMRTHHYQQYDYTVARSDMLEEIVEIPKDHQNVRVSIRNRGFWRKGGLLGKMLPCTW